MKIDHFEFKSSPFSSSVSTNDTHSACELKFSAEGLVMIKEAPSSVASCWPFSDSFTMDPFKVAVAARRRLRDFVTGSRPSVSPVKIYLISIHYLIWIISCHRALFGPKSQNHPKKKPLGWFKNPLLKSFLLWFYGISGEDFAIGSFLQPLVD